MEKANLSKLVIVDQTAGLARAPASIGKAMKARQSAKISELRQALIDDGYQPLDQQAAALGLSRSTAWAVLNRHHKASGLSAALINRMLGSPQLPPKARQVLQEYVVQKINGAYGHSKNQARRFHAQLMNDRIARIS